MKSVMQSAWLLTVAVGNAIVAILTEIKIFEQQVSKRLPSSKSLTILPQTEPNEIVTNLSLFVCSGKNSSSLPESCLATCSFLSTWLTFTSPPTNSGTNLAINQGML